jgi:drug/metabolite transporter (DMT)-like permease
VVVSSFGREPRLIATVSALGLGGYVLASLGTLYAVKIADVSFFALLTLLSPPIVVALLKERLLSICIASRRGANTTRSLRLLPGR